MEIAVSDSLSAVLKRSARRRTIGIRVAHGAVQVSAPVEAPLDDIHQFVSQKKAWILRHLKRQEQLQSLQSKTRYGSGEIVYWLGQPLTIQTQSQECTVRDGGTLRLLDASGNTADRAVNLANWYIDEAAQYIPQRVSYWSEQMGLYPSSIKIRHYKSRWGSCDRRGGIHFNWLLMMAPGEVIDYVVVHEIAHLKHFNHSHAFWRLVAQAIPDYAAQRNWLKQQKHLFWQLED